MTKVLITGGAGFIGHHLVEHLLKGNTMTKVLITGGAGFIGHHLVEHLLKTTNWSLTLLDRLDSSGNLNRLTEIGPWLRERHRVRFVHHDLKAEVNAQVANKIGYHDYVLHLAAATHVDRSIDDPLSFVMDNVVGTCNLLSFLREMGCEKMIHFSTDEVFGPATSGQKFDEWDNYNSGNPYAASKAGAEELCLAFQNTYKIPVSIVHCMNVFGQRQHPEKFVPLVTQRVRDGELVKIHANATKTVPGSRFYIHARNVAAAILWLLERAEPGDKYNIVGEREVNNLQLAQLIAAIVGRHLNYELVDFHSSRPGHDLRYALDGRKMSMLGWQIPQTFEESLRSTVEWSLKHPEWLEAKIRRSQLQNLMGEEA